MWFSREKIFFGCNQCGECCRDMDIPLNHYDIYSILQSKPKFDIETFITLHPATADEFDAVRLYGGFTTLYLTNKLSDNSCIFLENNACSIYNHRPNSCRTWPFSKNSSDKLNINNVAGEIVSIFCDKTPFKESKKTLKTINYGINEVSEYRKLIQLWNKEVEDLPEKQTLEFFIEYMTKKL